MSFADTLVRLRNAVLEGERTHERRVRVLRGDLHELLYHFDRIDREYRDLHRRFIDKAEPETGAQP